MPVTVLGVSAHYHDSSAAIVRDGEVVAACEEERFTRRKHEHCFPAQAINACLERAWVEPSELDAAVVHDDPLLTLDRVLHNVAGTGTSGRERWSAPLRRFSG